MLYAEWSKIYRKEDRKKGILMSKEIVIKRVTQEMKEGMYINLGIGIPTLIAGCN